MKNKIINSIFLTLIAGTVLASAGCAGTAVAEQTEAAADISFENEAAINTVEYISDFKSDFEARKAVIDELDLPMPAEHYSDDFLSALSDLSDDVNSSINNITAENAGDWIIRIRNFIAENMAEKAGVYENGPLPRIYIYTGDGAVHSSYSGATITVTYPDDYDKDKAFVDSEAMIKLRGNSTKDQPKHPYTIKFTTKRTLCGMDEGKKWVLLANLFDKTQLRNKLAFDFCGKLRFDYSPECEFVELYLEGEYIGLYLLCEPVTDGSTRVDIDADNGDYLLELEMERVEEGETYCISSGGVRVKINKPEGASFEKARELKMLLNSIEQSITDDSYDDTVDLDSFVDFYIFKELFKDVDAFYSSTRFYIKDGKLYAGPVWDSDLTLGNASAVNKPDVKYWRYNNVNKYGDGSGDSANGEWNDFGWFAMLWKSERFRCAVLERWNELLPLAENLYKDNGLGKNSIDLLLDDYREAIDKNYTEGGWDLYKIYSDLETTPADSYDGNITWMKEWLERRIAVLDTLFEN